MKALVLNILILLLLEVNTSAQFNNPFEGGLNAASEKATKVKLLISHETAKSGSTIMAGIEMTMDEGWHTYWINPGTAGIPTSVKWELPDWVTAGEIQWPVPEKFQSLGSTGYGYKNTIVLIVPLFVSENAPLGQVELSAKVSWLECEIQCNPRNQEVSANFVIGQALKESSSVNTIRDWKEKIPQRAPVNIIKAKAWWGEEINQDERRFIVEFESEEAGSEVDFFSFKYADFEFSPESKINFFDDSKVRVEKTVLKFEGQWPVRVQGLLVFNLNDYEKTRAVELDIPIEIERSATLNLKANNQSLGMMLLYAFLGGLLLNVMPCVLPVISLKILGFVNHGHKSKARVRMLGVLYGMGVFVSFMILATIVISVKSAGELASWGMQMSNPQFVVLLTILVTLVALNLFGLFEVTLGSVGVAAGSVSSKEGASGAFFNGVLATVLATPCTAPFLAPALGFAFMQSADLIILIFAFVALGLALPYVILSWNPKWLRFLPKPGPWMEKFKISMGFPMMGTVIWLFMLNYEYYGDRILWLGIFLIILSMSLWVFGEFFQRGTKRKGLALGIAGLLGIGGFIFGLEGQFQWRKPIDSNSKSVDVVQDFPGGIQWHNWSPSAVIAAQKNGQTVLVDFTAKWCMTCIANKKTSIDISSVRSLIAEKNIKAFRADFTRRPDHITRELAKWNRVGVPLVLVFSADINKKPQILPEVLTPSIVLEALNKSAG
ncbi:MAG: hypothetical protein CMO44_05500 [Verrucomicrobiales bacterium]|nr:hypothetical protein [Verrucomicrobiales bacterium]